MELLRALDWLFAARPEGAIVWRVDPGLRLQACGPWEEARIVANAVPKRQREFRSGRNLARSALAALRMPTDALLRDPDRLPLWPDAVVGSITHSDSLALAAVARSADFAGIGIDVERVAPLSAALANMVLNDIDRAVVERDPPANGAEWITTVFSAKEAFYKAVFPRLRAPLDFPDAAILFDTPLNGRRGEFRVQPLRSDLADASLCERIEGRWARAGRHVLTAAVLLHADYPIAVSSETPLMQACASPGGSAYAHLQPRSRSAP